MRVKMIRDAVKANEPQIAIIAGFLGPFTMMYWYLTDLATLSLLVYDDPELIDEMNAAYVQWALESVRIAFESGGDRRLRPGRRLGRLHGPAHVPARTCGASSSSRLPRSCRACGTTACR